jgi:NAD(P)-dependent dehydrogenase (short-subunit alcohol dehydrogenase family)
VRFQLSDRTAFVTGASSGIGRELCLALAAAGARVVAGARRQDRLADLVSEIRQRGGIAEAVTIDVADEVSVRDAFKRGEAALGMIDTVYANAGTQSVGPSVDLSAEDFDKVIATNLRGVFLTAREAGRRMMAQNIVATGRGRIVIIGSIGASKPIPGALSYCASKAGAVMVGRTLALEWIKAGINVNVVCPGSMVTEINAWFYETPAGQAKVAEHPRARLMEVDDLQALCLYLGSDASRAVTGSVFTVDDGQTL